MLNRDDIWMEAPPLERKLAAILAADVEGYSRLMHGNEERTLAALTTYRRIVDQLIETANGKIFGTAGDSVLAEFPSVVVAFNCAVAIQAALFRANEAVPERERMRFRIGINVGDVMVKNGDIFGDGVNIATRVEGLSEAGGICVTRGVRDHLRDKVDVKFEDLGEHSVKNIARPIRVFRVDFDPAQEPDFEPASSNSGSLSARAELASTAGEAEIVYWQSVEASEDPKEYRLYLERFPDGEFAEIARTRLNNPEQEENPEVELAFWQTVRSSQNPEMVRAYLEKFPDGAFSSLAKILLDDLSSRSSS
jgi:adenylate cyclase